MPQIIGEAQDPQEDQGGQIPNEFPAPSQISQNDSLRERRRQLLDGILQSLLAKGVSGRAEDILQEKLQRDYKGSKLGSFLGQFAQAFGADPRTWVSPGDKARQQAEEEFKTMTPLLIGSERLQSAEDTKNAALTFAQQKQQDLERQRDQTNKLSQDKFGLTQNVAEHRQRMDLVRQAIASGRLDLAKKISDASIPLMEARTEYEKSRTEMQTGYTGADYRAAQRQVASRPEYQDKELTELLSDPTFTQRVIDKSVEISNLRKPASTTPATVNLGTDPATGEKQVGLLDKRTGALKTVKSGVRSMTPAMERDILAKEQSDQRTRTTIQTLLNHPDAASPINIIGQNIPGIFDAEKSYRQNLIEVVGFDTAAMAVALGGTGRSSMYMMRHVKGINPQSWTGQLAAIQGNIFWMGLVEGDAWRARLGLTSDQYDYLPVIERLQAQAESLRKLGRLNAANFRLPSNKAMLVMALAEKGYAPKEDQQGRIIGVVKVP